MRQIIPIPPCPPPPVSMQYGGIAMPMMVSVLVLGASMLALQAAKQTRRPLAEQRTTEQRLDRIEQALRAYVLIHQKLPCAADGAFDTGLADLISGACNTPGGTVPWATLGLQKDDALDGWSRKISYRVFAGNTALIPPPPTLPARFQVEDAYSTLSPVPEVAWVLISHGPTGLGAWRSGQNPASRVCGLAQMPPVNSDECYNTLHLPVPPAFFVRRPPEVLSAVGQTLDPAIAVNHFDDVVRYKTLKKLAVETGLSGIDPNPGPPPPPPSVAPNAASVTLNTGTLATSGVTFSGFSSGQQTLTIPTNGTAPGMTVAVQAGQQISVDNTGGNPKTGLGVCNVSGSCNATNSELSGTETLSFKLVNATAYRFGVLLDKFTLAENVQITFKLNGVQVGAVVSYTGSFSAIDLTPTVASAAFDEVVIGAVGASSFFIDAVRFCDASTSTSCVP